MPDASPPRGKARSNSRKRSRKEREEDSMGSWGGGGNESDESRSASDRWTPQQHQYLCLIHEGVYKTGDTPSAADLARDYEELAQHNSKKVAAIKGAVTKQLKLLTDSDIAKIPGTVEYFRNRKASTAAAAPLLDASRDKTPPRDPWTRTQMQWQILLNAGIYTLQQEPSIALIKRDYPAWCKNRSYAAIVEAHKVARANLVRVGPEGLPDIPGHPAHDIKFKDVLIDVPATEREPPRTTAADPSSQAAAAASSPGIAAKPGGGDATLKPRVSARMHALLGSSPEPSPDTQRLDAQLRQAEANKDALATTTYDKAIKMARERGLDEDGKYVGGLGQITRDTKLLPAWHGVVCWPDLTDETQQAYLYYRGIVDDARYTPDSEAYKAAVVALTRIHDFAFRWAKGDRAHRDYGRLMGSLIRPGTLPPQARRSDGSHVSFRPGVRDIAPGTPVQSPASSPARGRVDLDGYGPLHWRAAVEEARDLGIALTEKDEQMLLLASGNKPLTAKQEEYIAALMEKIAERQHHTLYAKHIRAAGTLAQRYGHRLRIRPQLRSYVEEDYPRVIAPPTPAQLAASESTAMDDDEPVRDQDNYKLNADGDADEEDGASAIVVTDDYSPSPPPTRRRRAGAGGTARPPARRGPAPSARLTGHANSEAIARAEEWQLERAEVADLLQAPNLPAWDKRNLQQEIREMDEREQVTPEHIAAWNKWYGRSVSLRSLRTHTSPQPPIRIRMFGLSSLTEDKLAGGKTNGQSARKSLAPAVPLTTLLTGSPSAPLSSLSAPITAPAAASASPAPLVPSAAAAENPLDRGGGSGRAVNVGAVLRNLPPLEENGDMDRWLNHIDAVLRLQEVPLSSSSDFLILALDKWPSAQATAQSAYDEAIASEVSNPFRAVCKALQTNYGTTEDRRRFARTRLAGVRMAASETAEQYWRRWDAAKTEAYKGQPFKFDETILTMFIMSLPNTLRAKCQRFVYRSPDIYLNGGATRNTNTVDISNLAELRDSFLLEDRTLDNYSRSNGAMESMMQQALEETITPADLAPLANIGRTNYDDDTSKGARAFHRPRLGENDIRQLSTALDRSGHRGTVDILAARLKENGRQSERANRRRQRSPSRSRSRTPPRDEQGRFKSAQAPQQRPQQNPAKRQRQLPQSRPGFKARAFQTDNGSARPAAASSSGAGPATTAAASGSTHPDRQRQVPGGPETVRRDMGKGPCSSCGHPNHSWDYCGRNKNGKNPSEAALKYANAGPFYTGKLNADGTAERVARLGGPAPGPTTFKTRRLEVNEHGQKEIVIDCRFGRVPAHGAILDTGAQRSVISGRYYDLHRSNFPPVNRRVAYGLTIEGITGDYYKPRGEIRVPIAFCDKNQQEYHIAEHAFLVVDGLSTDVLLGMDLMQGDGGIKAIEFTSGQISFSPALRTTPYSTVKGNAARYPIRLLHDIELQPGETAPIGLSIGDDEEDHRAHIGGSLLVNPTLLTSASRTTQFILRIPEHLRTLEDRDHRTFRIPATNPTNRVVRIRRGLIVAEGVLIDDRTIRAVPAKAPQQRDVMRLRRTRTQQQEYERRLGRLPTAREKQAWMDYAVDKMVDALMSHPEHTRIAHFSTPVAGESAVVDEFVDDGDSLDGDHSMLPHAEQH